MKKIIVLGLVFFTLVSFIYGNEKDVKIQQGIELHNLDSEKDESNIDKSMELLKPFIETDQIACAYYGSDLTKKAMFCSNKDPLKALKFLEEGSSYIDAAVKMDEKNIVVRCLRLANGISVSKSSPLKRYSIVEKDMEFLLQDNILCSVDNATKSFIYFYSGLLKIEQGFIDEAMDFFDFSIECDADGNYGKESELMLIKYGE